ncbi:LysR substrate-binding domain-containing protein [Niveibacterium sp. SC-1]|uniref:LysR substrate-binding domain-containing protein n=1 Tax=Niveibacterium sp. SC-1 TaxID=3135646 RepID=UPI00311FB7F5
MHRLPPLACLEAFDAAARLGSFQAAAETLNVSASAISHRIRALETQLGERLFERHHRSIALTARGAAYHAEVARALDALATATADFTQGGRRGLRLSVAPAFGRAWLLSRLADYGRQEPLLDVALSASTQMTPIGAGEVDLGIRFLAEAPAGLAAWSLSDERLFPVCSPQYAAEAGLLAPADLARARLLRHPLLSWSDWFRAAGLQLAAPSEGPLFEDGALMLDACAAGHGVALSTSSLAAAGLANGRLVQPFAASVAAGHFFLIAAPHAREKPWVERFARWLAAAARQDASPEASA